MLYPLTPKLIRSNRQVPALIHSARGHLAPIHPAPDRSAPDRCSARGQSACVLGARPADPPRPEVARPIALARSLHAQRDGARTPPPPPLPTAVRPPPHSGQCR